MAVHCRRLYPLWEVFPRVFYFHNRYSDYLTRCKRVLDRLPKGFNTNKDELHEVDQIGDDLGKGIEINIIGDELVLSGFIAMARDKQRHGETEAYGDSGIKVTVYSLCIEQLDMKGLEEVQTLLRNRPQNMQEDSRRDNIVFLLCKVRRAHLVTKVDDFRKAMNEDLDLNETGIKIPNQNILIGIEVEELKEKLSDEVERKIMHGFQKISSMLEPFDLVENNSNKYTGNILESKPVQESVDRFIRSHSIFKEIVKSGNLSQDKVLKEFLSSLSGKVRCSAVYPLASKYSINIGLCNKILWDYDFEKALANSVQASTKFHIQKIAESDFAKPNTSKRFNCIINCLRSDMGQIFKKTEEKLEITKRFAMVVRRLRFEVDGYIGQSTVVHSSLKEMKEIPKELRKDLLSIDGVYGVGHICGKLEIHITDEFKTPTEDEDTAMQTEQEIDHERMETEVDKSELKSFSSEKIDVKREICYTMKRHNFHYPYVVRLVQKPPEKMNNFTPGDPLHCLPEKKNGTLGAFAKSSDNKLYGLTCAHVVSHCDKIFVQQQEGKCPFGIKPKIVKTGDDKCTLIDIAAVEVVPSLQSKCTAYLDSTTDCVRKVDIIKTSSLSLVGRFVCKYGAVTELTTGVIVSIDYSQFGPNAEDYVVIVDPLAGTRQEDIPNLSREFTSLLQTSAEESGEAVGAHAIQMEEDSTAADIQKSLQMTQIVDDNVHISKEQQQQSQSTQIAEVLYKRTAVLTSSSPTQSMPNIRDDALLENVDAESENLRSFLYVKNICESALSNCQRRDIFAERGDSGSVICAQSPSHQGGAYVAVAMLSGGDLQLEGLSGNKALSFMLKDGLRKLREHHQIDFLCESQTV